MQFTLQLVATDSKDQQSRTYDIMTLEKDYHSIEQLGLTLLESKDILAAIQTHCVQEQVSQYLNCQSFCIYCGKKLRCKGHHSIKFRTSFGDLQLASPRFYQCSCTHEAEASFSPLKSLIPKGISPELLYIESKWASLVSYGLTVKLLKDFLPLGTKFNAATVRNHTLKIAEKSDAELGEERYFFIDGCPRQWEQLPEKVDSISMGLDGGYIRHWENKKKNFEVIVGKSIPETGQAKCFGLVQSHDKKPKRRVFEVLKSQGMQMNQKIYCLSDGADNLRQLQLYLNPEATHILDWFHISMRFTVLNQYAKGYAKHDKQFGTEIMDDLESAKRHLWHGHVRESWDVLEDIAWTINPESSYPKIKKFEQALDEMLGYIQSNSAMIINYGEYWRSGKRISTGFIESLVNTFISKRFAKKQQMQWTPIGAHLLIQIRSKVINNELEGQFQKWYPNFHKAALAANDNLLKMVA